jgi:energy-coupling factor transporter ATP-binding protein EcfA2
LTGHLRALQSKLESLGVNVPEVQSSLVALEYYERQNAIVLCGITGAGKSTLLNLLMGHDYLPTKDTLRKTDAGVSVTPISIEIRRTKSMGNFIQLEAHLIEDVSWRMKRRTHVTPAVERGGLSEESKKFFSKVFEDPDHGFDFNNAFDWRSHEANLEYINFDDPVATFLRSKRVVIHREDIANKGKIADKVHQYIEGSLAGIVKKIVIVGSFTDSHLPEETIIYDIPGSGDINTVKETERQNMMKRARRAIIVVNHSSSFLNSTDASAMLTELENTKIDNTDSLLEKSLVVFNRAWPTLPKKQNFEQKWAAYEDKIKKVSYEKFKRVAFVDEVEVSDPKFTSFFDSQILSIKNFIAEINLEKEKVFTQVLDKLRFAACRLGTQRADDTMPDTSELIQRFKQQIDRVKASILRRVVTAPSLNPTLHESFKKNALKFTPYWNSSNAFTQHCGIYSGATGSADVPSDFANVLLGGPISIDWSLLTAYLAPIWQANATRQLNASLSTAMAKAIHSVIIYNYSNSGFLYGPYYDCDGYVTMFMKRFWRDWNKMEPLINIAIEYQFTEFLKLVEQRVLLLAGAYQDTQLTVAKIKLPISASLPLNNHHAISLLMTSVNMLFKIWLDFHPTYQFEEAKVKLYKFWESDSDDGQYLIPTFTSLALFDQAIQRVYSVRSSPSLIMRYLGLSDDHLPSLKKLMERILIMHPAHIIIDVTGNSISAEAIQSLNTNKNIVFVDHIKHCSNRIILPAAPKNRIAVVLGNSNYSQPIGSCQANQLLVRKFLQACHFTVLDKSEITSRNDWDNLMTELSNKLKESTGQTFLVFFYSGHGGLLRAKHCIVATDDTVIPLTALYHECRIHNSINLFLMDCCQSNITEAQQQIINEAEDQTFPICLHRAFATCPLNYAYGAYEHNATEFTRINIEHLTRAKRTGQSVIDALRAATIAYDQLPDIQKGQPYSDTSGVFPHFTL